MARNPLLNTMAVVASLGIVALVGWRAGAESSENRSLAAPTVVATVDVERVFAALEELKSLNDSLGKRVEGRNAELKALGDQIDSFKAELEQLPTNDVQHRRDLVVRLAEAEELRKAKLGIYKRLIDLEQGEIIQALYLKFLAAVEETAGKQGCDLVLFDNRAIEVPQNVPQSAVNDAIQAKSILYASNGLDISDQVIVLMNNKYQTGVN